jgi:hypothetical protein
MTTQLAAVISLVISEIVAGEALSMGEAGRIIPALRGQKRTDPATIWRWVNRGHKLPDGSILKLEAAKMAGRWLTSKSALARFMERITAASTPQSENTTPPVQTRTATARQKSSERACAKLAAMNA